MLTQSLPLFFKAPEQLRDTAIFKALLSTTNDFIKQVITAVEVRSGFNVRVENRNVMGFSRTGSSSCTRRPSSSPELATQCLRRAQGGPPHPRGTGCWALTSTTPALTPAAGRTHQVCRPARGPRGSVSDARESRSDCKAWSALARRSHTDL